MKRRFSETFTMIFLCLAGILVIATTFAWAGIIAFGVIKFIQRIVG